MPGGHQQALQRGDGGNRRAGVVDQLDDLSGAQRADVEDVFAQRVQQRPCIRQVRVSGANDERELPLPGRARTPGRRGDCRIEHAHTLAGERTGDCPRLHRIAAGGIDYQQMRPRRMDQARLAETDRLDGVRVRQGQNDLIAGRADGCRRGGSLNARGHRRCQACGIRVVAMDHPAQADQPARHGAAQTAQTDHANRSLCHRRSS